MKWLILEKSFLCVAALTHSGEWERLAALKVLQWEKTEGGKRLCRRKGPEPSHTGKRNKVGTLTMSDPKVRYFGYH